ncbi:MbcA/ParS/Xre antitoxin family protein [Deinococcus sp.]|uniref:MbcA/ParS/Xre antitoxin family protein n=1 Tax=Deinococcus sp. TaxID=47478 RepID=UPI00286DB3FE|nr:MbcA/ParS/Xre antitoxin family protein [Deinococcus sp.]
MNETLEDGLAQQLHDTLGSAETAAAWLRTPNPVLAGGTPTAYLQRGDTAAVRKLLLLAETGTPT